MKSRCIKKSQKTFIKLISMFYYNSTLYLMYIMTFCAARHKSYLLHKRVDIMKQHIVTHHIYLYLINPIKYLLFSSDISVYLNQSFTCSRYQLRTNQTYLQECDRNTKKCLAASVRKSHHWWRFSAAFRTVRSFASHHRLSY